MEKEKNNLILTCEQTELINVNLYTYVGVILGVDSSFL